MQNRERCVIALLMAGISLITFTLGSLMYFANLKKMVQNTIGVELADFIFNINYSMQFGKQIETFYGMDERLLEQKAQFQDIQEMFVLSGDNTILFATAEEKPAVELVSMPAGENKTEKDRMFCMYEINADSRILVSTGAEGIRRQTRSYELQLAVKAAAGTAAAIALMLVLSFLFKNKKRAVLTASAMMYMWIFVFGGIIGLKGYQTYSENIKTVVSTIEHSVNADFARIESMGVERAQIHETERYMERYLEMVPEIEEIHMEQGNLRYKISASYMGKELLDYVLQTILLMTFSILILTEYRIFAANYQIEKTEVRNV